MAINIGVPLNWRIRFLIVVAFSEGCVGCIFRSSSWNTITPPIVQPTDQEEAAIGKQPLVLDKDTVSIVEQTLVKTLITMGKLKFHCPRDDGLYSDKLDCRKYYKCITGNFTTVHECEVGTGFDPTAKSCVGNASVSLCQRVQRLDGYECKSTGLKTMPGHCDKFILCTGEAAFTSSCHRGDLFDQKLKLCLPEREANCNAENASVDQKNDNLSSKM